MLLVQPVLSNVGHDEIFINSRIRSKFLVVNPNLNPIKSNQIENNKIY